MSETCGSAPSSLPLSGPGTPGKEPTVLEMADSAGPDKLLALKDAAATLQSAMASVQRSAMGAALGDARRLLRTLQAKVQAVEAFASLREAMREVEEASSAREKEAAANGTPSASAPLVTPRLARQRLRSAIPAGEAAVQALRGVVGSAELSALQDRLTEARRRHVGERAVESLEKLVSGASSVSELGRLEQAIREAEQFSKGATHESVSLVAGVAWLRALRVGGYRMWEDGDMEIFRMWEHAPKSGRGGIIRDCHLCSERPGSGLWVTAYCTSRPRPEATSPRPSPPTLPHDRRRCGGPRT